MKEPLKVVPEKFDPKSCSEFTFEEYHYNPQSSKLYLRYSMSNIEFEEVFHFHLAKTLDLEALPAFKNACKLLHLIAGISYYKAAVPEQIKVNSYKLQKSEADFLSSIYSNGLGEFFFRNNLEFKKIKFPFESVAEENALPAQNYTLTESPVVPLGGGKDSLVSCQLLKSSNIDFRTFIMGDFPQIHSLAQEVGVPVIHVSRTLSPVLFELNKKGAYNGHIPISAVIAATLAVGSFVYGYDTAVLSNEHSANFGNVKKDGFEVNHQYSKSEDFEQGFTNYISESLGANFRYFSLLRPLSEIAIGKLFSKVTDYDQHFTSCNKTFRQAAQSTTSFSWCCQCPKCCSTFLCLAPFMPIDRLLNIFGDNLLDDTKLLPIFRELSGLTEVKPFECVLDFTEALAVIKYLDSQPEWKNASIIKELKSELDFSKAQKLDELLAPHSDRLLPDNFKKILHAYLQSER